VQTHISTRFFADARILVVRARFSRFPPKEHPIAHQRAQKKKRTRKPAFEEKGQLAIFLSETTRANGNLRFLLRAFLPFRESFILSDGHNVRSRQNYDAGRRRCAKQFFFSLFFFERGRPAQVAQPQTSRELFI
jgi:hypothetical protein